MIARRFASLLLAAVCVAASPGAHFNFDGWDIETTLLDANYVTGSVTMPHALTMTKNGSTIRADRGVGNYKTFIGKFYGHVVLHDSNGVLTNVASGATKQVQPATLTCDELDINGKNSYTAIGNVHFTQGGSTATADRAVMNTATHEIELSGHVHLLQ